MAPATEETVLGDFDDVAFEHAGIRSKFYRKAEKYFVQTQGPGGRLGEFEVAYTFGWYPLQQYLIPFPGGRLQCLPIAWNAKDKKWYHLYPERKTDSDDWLYWTNPGQNWNGMCAECHSTCLEKNYDIEQDVYKTTWSEISIGCEACHGPSSEHVKWANTPEMGRPQIDHVGLVMRTTNLTAQEQIELCAPCHSRRTSLGNNPHTNKYFLDYAVPRLLTDDYYFSDGQILEEVYVYGSFTQSKMFAREIRCSDCHDVHSIERVLPGNTLCLQCHKAAIYDTKDHHFHKKEGEEGKPIMSENGKVRFTVGSGAQCEQCHMPGRVYMGIDYRPDHSFRIPRPDLSASIGVPNACNRCHEKESIQWSIDTVKKWYGERKREHFGTIVAAGRKGDPETLADLVRLANDRLYPAIVRATVLTNIVSYPTKESKEALHRSLADEDPLLRFTALRVIPRADPQSDIPLVGPLLYDSIKAVRIEAARLLSTVPLTKMPTSLRKRFQVVLAEYEEALDYTADFPATQHNLGNLYTGLGQDGLAIQHYRKAIEIDDLFYPAKVNLAMTYNRRGKKSEAERLFREVIAAHPNLHEVKYSLALLLAEQQKYREAASYLQQASDGMSYHSRAHYNLGLLYQRLRRDGDAESAFKKALAMEPSNPEYLYALALFLIQRERLDEARQIVEQMLTKTSTRALGRRLVREMRRLHPDEPE